MNDKQKEMLYIRQNGECYIDKDCKWNDNKKIEEMAREFCPIVCPNQCNHRCANVGNCQELKEACIKIRDLGYRNVKDKVVLDKEEYIENDRLMKLLEEKRLDELKSIHKIFDEVRKKTAREIFAKVKQALNYLDNEWEISNALYQIEKQYGVEEDL